MKKLLIGLGVILVIIVAAIFFVGSNLNSIVKNAIEKYGSEALGVQVSVASVELDVVEGNGSIRGLTVDNPDGFSNAKAMSFGELTLNFDYESLAIELIRAGAPEVNVEMQGTSSNIDALLGGMGGESAPDTEESEPVSLTINRIEIEAARAAMTSDVLDRSIEIEIPSVVLQDLEGTGAEISAQIMKQLLSQVRSSIRNAAKNEAQDKLEEKVDELKEEAKESLLDRLRN